MKRERGAAISRYEIISVISKGRMGEVFPDHDDRAIRVTVKKGVSIVIPVYCFCGCFYHRSPS